MKIIIEMPFDTARTLHGVLLAGFTSIADPIGSKADVVYDVMQAIEAITSAGDGVVLTLTPKEEE
jgi:hypothetical protein